MSDQSTLPPSRTAEGTDRNLLVALLAFQNEFIEPHDLRAAFDSWSASQTSSIADLLVAKKKLTAPQRQLIEDQAAEQLRKHAQQCTPSPGLESTGPVPEASLEGTVSLVTPPISSKPHMSPSGRGPALQPAGQRFRVLRPHAEGGLGKVSVARDEELNREVALKEIKPQFAHQVSARNRFLLEAEITGGLEHPGIVPVYSLGANEDGLPYYAMRFIQGDSLKDAIHAFFIKYGGKPSRETKLPVAAYQSLEFRRLLGRFVTVCNAISYAHSRGVLHRDIKPGNIMLGSFGETLVVDWGLAKVTGTAESAEAQTMPLAVHSLSDTASAETMMGTAIGTIGYMSPEQAGGRIDQFGPATDIYLLGATLYHLLTGQPPHMGPDTNKILIQIQQDEVANPRQYNKSIPAPLAAICLKAMALQSNERYTSAQDIAAELERYLADEPVKAHREPLTVRVRRTLRKHPALTAAFTATLLVGVIGFGAGYVLLGNKNKELASKNQQLATATTKAQTSQLAAEKNAQEAETRRVESSKLAQFWIGLLHGTDPVGHGTAALIPKTKEESFTVGDMLTEGATRAQNDPTLKDLPLAQAAILYTMGDVNRQLGRYDEAFPLLEQSLAIRRRELPRDSPELAASMNAMGCYYQERGEYPKADALFQEVVAIRRRIPTPEGRADLATTLVNLAAMRGHEEDLATAEKLFREVIAIRESLPVKSDFDMAIAKMGLAFTLFEQHRSAEALQLVAESQAVVQAISARQRVPSAAMSFAIGTISRATLGNDVAEGQLRSALKNLLQEFDQNSVWVAMVQFELANVLEDQKNAAKVKEADEHYAASLKICREQIKLRHPRVRVLIQNYAKYLARNGRQQESDGLWQEFLAAQLETFGEEHRVVLLARLDYAEYLRYTGQYKEQLALLQPLQAALQPDPRMHLAYLIDLGRCYLENQQEAAAIEVLRVAEQLELPAPPAPEDSVRRFDTRYWLATALRKQDPPAGVELTKALRQEARQLDAENAKEALKDVLEQLVEIADKQRDYVLLLDAGVEYYKLLGGVTGAPSPGFLGGFSLPNPFAAPQPVADSDQLIKLRHRLALAHEYQGHYDKALPYWRESVSRGEKQFGPDHNNSLNRRRMLKNCEQMIGEQQWIASNLALRKPNAQFPKITASHASSAEKVERANDGIIHYSPAAPQRWTSFGSPNASDWLEVEFEKPTKFSRIELAIYDEGNAVGVKAPAECYAEIWNGEAWVRIADQANNPEQPVGNRWNAIDFPAVSAKRVRVVFVHARSPLPNTVHSGISELAIWP